MDFLATSKQILINIDAQQESDLFIQLARHILFLIIKNNP